MASDAPPPSPKARSTPPANGYGEAFADVYDDWYRDVSDAAATAAFVAERSAGGSVLELGVGTGRLAEPLARVGVAVVGLDASAAMLDRCRRRGLPGLDLVRADMAALPFRPGGHRAGGHQAPFGAALIAFNTLFNLGSAAAQRSLFGQLGPLVGSGVVVVEALDGEVLAATPGRAVGPGGVDPPGGVTVVATEVDVDSHTIDGRHLEIDDGGVRVRPWFLRWSTVAEIDGYARDARLDLVERYGGWDGTPYRPGCEVHVSVYRGRG